MVPCLQSLDEAVSNYILISLGASCVSLPCPIETIAVASEYGPLTSSLSLVIHTVARLASLEPFSPSPLTAALVQPPLSHLATAGASLLVSQSCPCPLLHTVAKRCLHIGDTVKLLPSFLWHLKPRTCKVSMN